MPAAYALMANAHGPDTRSRAIAMFGTSQMVGVAIGGSVSGYIAQHLELARLVLGARLYRTPVRLSALALPHSLPEFIREGNRSQAERNAGRDFRRLLGIPCSGRRPQCSSL